MAGKFEAAAAVFAADLEMLYVRAIRKALLAGLETAINHTVHDSSNAAAHWMLVAKSRSRPASRRFGKLRDLRSTANRAATPPVGRRRDAGKNKLNTVAFVRDKELREVIEKYVRGRSPETKFALYNALDPETTYGINAHIDSAGKAALETIKAIFDDEVSKGRVRVRFR